MQLTVFCTVSCIVLFLTTVDGFATWCNSNQTLFVPVGTNATFVVDQPLENDPYYLVLIKTRSMLRLDLSDLRNNNWNFSSEFIRFYDPLIENRTFVEGQFSNGRLANISITISDVRKSDNGTYNAYDYFYWKRYCWILFVMDIEKQPFGALEENNPTQIFGHPVASLMVRPMVNATVSWLLNGRNTTETAYFREQDGMMWIPNVRREMHLQNVTYRAIKETGEASEINYTLKVVFGPTWPLTLTPKKTQYFLDKGQTIPDITCSNDCNPACTVSWGEHSQTNTLHLGVVTTDTTGEYTCTASRDGSSVIVKTSILVYVSDTAFVTIAIPILISVQAITTIILGVCALCFFLRNKTSLWKPDSAFKKEQKMPTSSAAKVLSIRSIEDTYSKDTELNAYEELRGEVRDAPTLSDYEQMTNEGDPSNIGFEMYENISPSSSSSHPVTA